MSLWKRSYPTKFVENYVHVDIWAWNHNFPTDKDILEQFASHHQVGNGNENVSGENHQKEKKDDLSLSEKYPDEDLKKQKLSEALKSIMDLQMLERIRKGGEEGELAEDVKAVYILDEDSSVQKPWQEYVNKYGKHWTNARDANQQVCVITSHFHKIVVEDVAILNGCASPNTNFLLANNAGHIPIK